MKKILAVLLSLLVTVSFVNADSTGGDHAELTVLAYKKEKTTEGVWNMKIIDALTGKLNNIGSGDRIQVDDYVSKYVETPKKNSSGEIDPSRYSKLDLSHKAIFSLHINGNVSGTFKAEVTFGSFAKDGEATKYIKCYYFYNQLNAFFTSTGKGTGNVTTQTVKASSGTTTAVTVTNAARSLGFTVTAYDSAKSKSSGKTYEPYTLDDYWETEVMFAMIMDEESYGTIDNGVYMAPITVTVTAEN